MRGVIKIEFKDVEFGKFASVAGEFNYPVLYMKRAVDMKLWWVIHGACARILEPIATRLLGHSLLLHCVRRETGVLTECLLF